MISETSRPVTTGTVDLMADDCVAAQCFGDFGCGGVDIGEIGRGITGAG